MVKNFLHSQLQVLSYFDFNKLLFFLFISECSATFLAAGLTRTSQDRYLKVQYSYIAL